MVISCSRQLQDGDIINVDVTVSLCALTGSTNKRRFECSDAHGSIQSFTASCLFKTF